MINNRDLGFKWAMAKAALSDQLVARVGRARLGQSRAAHEAMNPGNIGAIYLATMARRRLDRYAGLVDARRARLAARQWVQ